MKAKEIYYLALGTFAAAGAAVAQFMGGWDGLARILAAAMLVDYITGALCALVWHRSPKTETGGYESHAGFKGLVRKGVIILIVMIAAELDRLAGTTAMRTATILFFTANDGMSILENLGIMGVPYPPALRNAFEVLRKQGDNKNTDEADAYQPQHEAVHSDPYEDVKKALDYPKDADWP